MILEEIKTKLEEIDPCVFYGMVDSSMKDTLWDYIVFNRSTLQYNTNRTGYSDHFTVHIIREHFIPEGLEEQIIEKMLEIAGMRLSGSNGTYTYVPKPNTNVVVEMFSVEFVRARKV